jgi:hypothetical protein
MALNGYINNTISTDRVTTSIIGYTNGLPQDTLLQATIKQQINSTDKISLATQIMRKSVDIGSAIVEFASHTGIAGFKFHLPKREQVKLQSDITDHYTDLNSPIQDHIARKPITITLNGLQGEYFHSVNQFEDAIALITPTLALVKEFLPKLPDRTKKYLANKYKSITGKSEVPEGLQTPKNAKDLTKMDLFNLFQDLYKLKSAQTRAYLFFEALWKSEALFTVETTLKRFNNMAVQNITAVRDENADIIDFTLEVKQMNFSVTTTTSLKNYTGRTRQQLSAISNKGLDKGKKVQV